MVGKFFVCLFFSLIVILSLEFIPLCIHTSELSSNLKNTKIVVNSTRPDSSSIKTNPSSKDQNKKNLLPSVGKDSSTINDIKTGTGVFKSLFNIPEEDHCFCELQGSIDDCTCQIEVIDSFNNHKVHPRLQSLLAKDYFRYFQVNLGKECPFWSDDSQCALEYCQVTECPEDKVPPGLKGQSNGVGNKYWTSVKENKRQLNSRGISSCKDDLGYINMTISEESQEGFERWKIYDNSLIDFCSIREDEVDPDLHYVDLSLNPERYTGYKGPSAHRIWRSIYLENCFQDGSTRKKSLMAPFDTSSQDDSCIEKRTFHRAISGLHASINIHLSAKYLLSGVAKSALFKPKNEEMLWGPNITEFKQHFDHKLTNGQSSVWLKNLYFLYLIELKALWKISPYLREFNFYTGNAEEDKDMKAAILDILGVIRNFPSHFEEKALFSTKDALKLKLEFHQRFTNITRIMDCVGCQKCKLWGKLQIKGLGTALKILFSEPFRFKSEVDFLSRNEVVAFFNAFGRLSESIYELENFRQLIGSDHNHNHQHNGETHESSPYSKMF